MWITTVRGFCSAVKDNQNRGQMLLRFRHIRHAEAFRALLTLKRKPAIRTTPAADYRWKFSVTHRVFLKLLEDLGTEAADYDNFKSACHLTPEMADMSHALHGTWAVWHRVQTAAVRQAAPAPAPAKKADAIAAFIGKVANNTDPCEPST